MDRLPAELELLQGIIARLDRLERLVEERLPPPPPVDARLAGLLRAAHLVTEGNEFNVPELAELSASRFPGADALLRAITAIIGRQPPGGLRVLGKFLARHAGRSVEGYLLERLPGGATPLYKVSRV